MKSSSQMLNSSTRNRKNETAHCQKSAKLAVLQERRWAWDLNLRLEYIICYDTGLWFTLGPESIQVLLLKRISSSAVLPQSHFSYLSQGIGPTWQMATEWQTWAEERDCGRKEEREWKEQTDVWISHSVSVRLLNWTIINMAFCTQANTTVSSQ